VYTVYALFYDIAVIEKSGDFSFWGQYRESTCAIWFVQVALFLIIITAGVAFLRLKPDMQSVLKKERILQ
jgi:drug/metabolite transporter superfamily protein YnfA